jgi:hypothetical protein
MIKRILIVTILFQCIFYAAFSQSLETYSSFKKEEIFSEHFQDNQNSWRKFYTKIKKGKYAVETIGNDLPALTTIPVRIETGRDYEIETEISLEWNRSKDFLGIVWNRDLNHGYYFGFNKENKMEVFKKEYDNVIVLDKISGIHSAIPMYTKSLITIRKIKDEYLIYVNRLLVFRVPADEHYGDHIGYFVGKASEIKAYKLTVSYIE